MYDLLHSDTKHHLLGIVKVVYQIENFSRDLYKITLSVKVFRKEYYWIFYPEKKHRFGGINKYEELPIEY